MFVPSHFANYFFFAGAFFAAGFFAAGFFAAGFFAAGFFAAAMLYLLLFYFKKKIFQRLQVIELSSYYPFNCNYFDNEQKYI